MAFSLPDIGFVFWPVGTGDSTSVCIDDETVMEVDLHNLVAADDDDDPRTPIVDRLVDLLPKRDDKPYLALFVLTHPDKDHCQGFKDLLKKVVIGEIWFAPRIFRENSNELCDDAVAFRKEAKRRVKKTIEEDGEVESGDRVRIIGYSDLLDEDDFKGFPEDRMSIPGDTITDIDGEDREDVFSAFVHSPFKDDDTASERNETSVGLRVELKTTKSDDSDDDDSTTVTGRALLLGDLSYPTLRRVWDESDGHGNVDKLDYNVFLSVHQCSKSAMYEKNEEGKDEKKQDILDDIENSAEEFAYIIASSDPIPSSNKKGDNPPHALAKARYEEIIDSGHFLCTGEHPDEDNPKPIVFELTDEGLKYVEPDEDDEDDDDDGDDNGDDGGGDAGSKAATTAFSKAVEQGSGRPTPPSERVGFGTQR